MNTELEIHVKKDGRVKVFEGPERRVFHSTEEAVGLALLKLNPEQVHTEAKWVDFLPQKGIAIGTVGNKSLTLLACPPVERTVTIRRGSETETEHKIHTPALLFATRFERGRLVKSMLFVIKKEFEKRLTVASTDPAVLAPFPYGNVYTHGGICWGTTRTQDLAHPSEVEGAFFGSGFNTDLFTTACGGGDRSFHAMIERTKGVLPVPTTYTKAVANVAQDIAR